MLWFTETKYEEKLKTIWVAGIYNSVRFIIDDALMNSANPFVLLLYKKWIASPGLMKDTGGLGLVHWDDLEGWFGVGGGWGVQDGNTCTSMADACWWMEKPIQYCKVKKKLN